MSEPGLCGFLGGGFCRGRLVAGGGLLAVLGGLVALWNQGQCPLGFAQPVPHSAHLYSELFTFRLECLYPSGLSAPSRRWKWELRPFGLGEQSWGHRRPPGQRGLLGGDPQAQASEYMSWRAGGSEEALGNVPRARVKPLVKEHTLLEGAGKSQAE